MYRHKDMHAHMKLLRLSHRQYLEQCEVHIHIGVWVTIILPPPLLQCRGLGYMSTRNSAHYKNKDVRGNVKSSSFPRQPLFCAYLVDNQYLLGFFLLQISSLSFPNYDNILA